MSETISKSKKLTVCAVCIALAFLLNQVSLFRMPMGGSITPASMLFIALAGYWLGPVQGILAGVTMGVLNSFINPVIYHPIQYLLDYPLAFGMIGISGLFRKQRFGLQIGYVAGVLGRFIMSFFSGMVFFGIIFEDMAPIPAAIFSLTYNMTYIVPEMIASLIIISLPAMKHAIDVVTKSIVTHADYIAMTKHKGSVTAKARLVTGAVIGALGGFAFVIASYIIRLEMLVITQYTSGMVLISNIPSRIPRMIERNTGQIVGLRTVGVLFLTLGITLILSTLMLQSENEPKIKS